MEGVRVHVSVSNMSACMYVRTCVCYVCQLCKWLCACVSVHVVVTGPPTAYWGWTSTWVGGAWNGVDVNMGGYGVVDEWE